MQRWTRPLLAEPDRVILSHVWTTSTCYKPLEIERTALGRVRKERVTFQLPIDLIERARNAVYWTPGATIAGLMEHALAAHLAEIEQHRGAPFPLRESALKTGRPIK